MIFPTSFAQLLLRLSDMNEVWAEVLGGFEQIQYKRGKILPSLTDRFYFLQEGTIRTSIMTVSGLEWIFLFQKQGCIFNELGVMKQGLNLNYICQTDIKVKILPASFIQDASFIKKYPHLFINFLEMLALKEAICYSYTFDLAFASARGRICQALLSLVKEHEGEQVFSPEVTQAEIASMMALHQTTVARVVKQLRKEGIIGAFTKKKLEIFSLEKLEEFGRELEN